MHTEREMAARAARLERLVSRRMRTRRDGLNGQVRRLRRELPPEVQRDLRAVAQAQVVSGHPRIAKQIDRGAMARAEARVRAFLTGPVLRERRVTRRLRWVGGLLLNLAIMGAGIVGVALWRGLI